MLVYGDNIGPSKLETAKKTGIVITDEEGFRNFLETGELQRNIKRIMEETTNDKFAKFYECLHQ